MTEQKAVKKISAKAIMADLKAEATDGELMEKYGISFQVLHDLFGKLIDAGLATQAYFNKRALSQAGVRKKEEKTKTCPYCGFSAVGEFTSCPSCGQDVTEWLDTVELTKILAGSFE